jgi:hypothetical protein
MKQKRFNILFLIVFALLISRMNMHRETVKTTSKYISDKCPHDTIEPSKDSIGPININR